MTTKQADSVNFNSDVTPVQAISMTLRDYFAAQVLIGLSIKREGKSNADDARNAYALADAMMEARKS